MTGNFRTFKRAHLFAVWQFEVRAQLREPLTVLYLLIFGLLSFAYAASDVVELVSARGAVPRTASWALMLAFGGLTAFGQVITTMIATTAMLRDEAQRTRELIATSGLRARTWFVARVLAALCVMMLVYAAMPLGVIVGTLFNNSVADSRVQALLHTAVASGRAFAVITLPTMIVVTLVLASAAAYSRRVLGVLAAALVLVGLWQLALGLVAQPHTAHLGALLDPFGNAPVLALTATWSEAERAARIVPLAGVLLINRVLWVSLAVTLAGVLLTARAERLLGSSASASMVLATTNIGGGLSCARSATASLRAFTSAWMRLDGGWRVVSALAVVNAVANAATRPVVIAASATPQAASVLLLVSTHARLFLILLATVYAGELVWRERDVRVDQLLGAMPVSRRALVAGRISGMLTAQWQIVGPLAASGLLLALLRTPNAADTAVLVQWSAWSVFVLWLPFVHLTVLSLTVHVLLDHKVLAHLLLIGGWVAAVIIDQSLAVPWWVRFAEAAPLMRGDAVSWGALAQRGAYWSAVSAACLLL
ncbi:hypothetical protein, partial [Gemmatimonas sp.]|uniref:hypothetical protein n=1 Tax=Gemmatimonas sp. TaxID=1962908 RepID=UPI003341A394